MCGSSLNKPKKEFTLSKFTVKSLMILAIQNCLVGLRLENENLSPFQCWTEGRSSMAVAEDLRPTATATVAEV